MILSLLACVRVGVRICLFSGWQLLFPVAPVHDAPVLGSARENRLSPRSSAHLTQGRSGPRLFWSLANSVLGGSVLGPSPLALTNACPLQRSYALALSRSGTRLLQRSVLRCHSFMPHAFVHVMFILH